MTIVNLTTVFKKSYFINIIEDEFKRTNIEFQKMCNEVIKNSTYSSGTDYNTFINAARKIRAINKNSFGNSWYSGKNDKK